MIKIGPLVATDYGQTCALLGLQEEPVLEVASLTESGLVLRSLAFWQHWVPCAFHVTPSIYVAREEGMVIGFISLHNSGKSKTCWRIDNLVVHPEHRGRGIAQELLRFVFAQFGSQGVSHFIAEVSTSNSSALNLFAACGFCRVAQVSYYRLIPNSQTDIVETNEQFRLASNMHRRQLFQLNEDSLPPDLRMILSLRPEDFKVKEFPPFTSVELRKNRLMRTRVWYWVCEDLDRKVLTTAVRVTAQPGLGYRMDCAVHPGWRHQAEELVNFAVNNLLKGKMPTLPIWVRVYDFQQEVQEALLKRGFERLGDYCLLSREHWQRAKHPKKRKANTAVGFPAASNPAINFPAT